MPEKWTQKKAYLQSRIAQRERTLVITDTVTLQLESKLQKTNDTILETEIELELLRDGQMPVFPDEPTE